MAAAQAADGSGIVRRKAHGKESAARYNREDAACKREDAPPSRRTLRARGRTPCAVGRTPRRWHPRARGARLAALAAAACCSTQSVRKDEGRKVRVREPSKKAYRILSSARAP